jgi:flagellar protein FlaG
MNDLKSNLISEPNAQSAANKGVGKQGKDLPVADQIEAKEATFNHSNNGEELSNAAQLVKEEQHNKEEIKEAVAKLQDYVQSIERNLDFELDEESGITIIRVYDATSSELIRQIPGDDAVSLAQKLNQEEPLTLFSAQV